MDKTVLKLLILLFVVTIAQADSVETVSDIISQAHKHDGMYTIGPDVSQQKALKLYESALAAEPDKKQKLHILHRMAQLNGSAYDIAKGEKPNYPKAIEFYKQIVEEYPPDEPLVLKAKISIGDHYTTQRNFEEALVWYKKVLELDISSIAEQIALIEQEIKGYDQEIKKYEQERIPVSREDQSEPYINDLFFESQNLQGDLYILKKQFKKMQKYQTVAVGQVVYAADRIGYIRTHGELRFIIENYAGTFIADLAADKLNENMDKMPQLWGPSEQSMPSPSNTNIKAYSPTPVSTNQTRDIICKPKENLPGSKDLVRTIEPNTSEVTKESDGAIAVPRAPPIFVYMAVIIIGKRSQFFRKS